MCSLRWCWAYFYLHHTIAFIWGMPNRWSYIQNSSWNCCCWPPCCSLPKQTRSNLSTPETFSSVCAFDYIFLYWKCAKWLLNYLSTSLRFRFVSLAPAISRYMPMLLSGHVRVPQSKREKWIQWNTTLSRWIKLFEKLFLITHTVAPSFNIRPAGPSHCRCLPALSWNHSCEAKHKHLPLFCTCFTVRIE